MSNGGKSYRSKVLRNELGFLWHNVDEQIRKALGLESVGEIATWMGYPSSLQYAEREEKYLALENKFTKEASMRADGKNLVFDTTGSVSQLKQDTLDALSEHTLIVHLDVGDNSLQKMIGRFFKEPKPVAWGKYFTMRPSESEEEALLRCYPELLKARLTRYRALAHVNVSASEMHDKTGKETLEIIKRTLSV